MEKYNVKQKVGIQFEIDFWTEFFEEERRMKNIVKRKIQNNRLGNESERYSQCVWESTAVSKYNVNICQFRKTAKKMACQKNYIQSKKKYL